MPSPWKVVACTTAFYTCLLVACARNKLDPRRSIKAISATHSLCTTIAALYILRFTEWPILEDDRDKAKLRDTPDALNPLIAGKSRLGNAVTSYETGYLLYDTGALVYLSRQRYPASGLVQAVRRLATHDSPVFLAHHASLIAAFGYLQTYIADGREKGVWVIVAMLLMNASNPLLHLRWWAKKSMGRVPALLSVANAAVFAATRFGVILWLLRKHGDYHHVSPMRAYFDLRTECKSGTAVLTAVNAIWWLGLLRGILIDP